MANVKLIFQGTEVSNTEDHELECFLNQHNDIAITLDTKDCPATIISLDISTAIKLAKTLRTEINKAKEVNNG